MKILFVHPGLWTFVAKDLEILRGRYDVRVLHFCGLRDLLVLWQGVVWCDLTFSWFCTHPAFFTVIFSKILRKKAMVVSGGYDVANVPEIGYGVYCGSSLRRRIKQVFSRFAFRLTDKVLAVSRDNMEETLRNAKVKSSKVCLVYHGFDHNKFRRLNDVKKEPVVLTVGTISRQVIEKKGYDLLVKAAQYLPEVRFLIVGGWRDDSIRKLRAEAPSNVEFTRELKGTELLKVFSRARVYAQISRHESFCCALAEAMLCECIPVVARKTALPEVAGDCGFYVEELTPEAVAAKIKEALSAGENCGKTARERIVKEFPIEKRKKEIIDEIESLCGIKSNECTRN